MLLEIALGLILVLILYTLLKKDPEPVLGIYSQPGKWYYLKKAVFVIVLLLRKRRMSKMKKQEEKGESAELGNAGLGFKSRLSVNDMECAQKLSDDPLAIDCMYFNGLNANGDYVLLRIARRHNREAEIWLYVNVKGVGFFQSLVHPDTTLYNEDTESFSAGGLKFEPLSPMRRWKVTFNGFLREGLCETWPPQSSKIRHVKFSFIWSAFTDHFDFDTDIYPGCLASSLAREKWSKEYFDRLKKSHQTHYEQWGELFGVVQVEGHEEKQLTLRGYRDHSYGVRDWYSFHRYAIHFAYLEDGSAFHVDSLSLPGTFSLLQCGYMSRPNAIMHPVSWTDMDMIELGENQDPPLDYEFNFTADGKSYHAKVHTHTVIKFYLHDDWRSMIFEQVSDYEVNGVKGYGIFEFLYRNPRRTPVHQEVMLPLLKEPDVSSSDSNILWLPFTALNCASSRLVGGKGCQLALLTQLSSTRFSVPSGFCLTIAAFELQVKLTESLRKGLDQLEKTACSEETTAESLQSACENVVNAFLKAPIVREVQEAIETALADVFGRNFSERLFAVRSSAAGEDGAEMSSAGQMETVLGVLGLEKIRDAIRFCWASSFAHTAVAYRRQNGQVVECPVGVVIQEMVPAKAAGVLFTRHPVTDNPGEMVLNANYGLGQSVVSGEAEPDQVIIARSWKDELEIKSRLIGGKKRRTLLTDNGISSVETGSHQNCCLDDDIILRLAEIGIELEKRFSSPRDIEFAVDDKNTIQLLQARPITSLDFDTEWLLMHEFDHALANDQEVLTTCNIQEMMPGAVTPLTYDNFIIPIDRAFQNMLVSIGIQPCVHFPSKFVVSCCSHAFINMKFLLGMYEGTNAMAKKDMAELAVLGKLTDELSMEEVESYNGKLPYWKRIWNAVKMVWVMYNANKATKYWDEKLEKFSISGNSLHELYHQITKAIPLLEEGWTFHILNSSSSGVWSDVLMAILCQNGREWKLEHYTDLALLLSKCENVFSADVPATILKLARLFQTKEDREKMVNSSPEEALDWLKSESSGKIGVEFSDFLSHHGHRCIREAEFRERSWQVEPTKVIRVLQSMVQTLPQNPTTRSKNEEISFSDLKSPTTFFSRLILRIMWPKARLGVAKREMSKHLSIKLVESFKQAYWQLAKMMVEQSRLPDRDLLYFLTHDEIGKLIQTRSARLIIRAQKRRQVLSKQMSLRFPKLSTGHPCPIDCTPPPETSTVTSLKVTGLPVSRGVVKGRVRVVTNLSEAASIQNGEILIVEYTDVGWSPYFPLISGLVTEIGGLLSHGAVVAREYGLPCVVNVSQATLLFRSGDEVILNGSMGSVEKVTAQT